MKKISFQKIFQFLLCLVVSIQVLATVTVMYLQWTSIVLGHGASVSVGSQEDILHHFNPLFTFSGKFRKL